MAKDKKKTYNQSLDDLYELAQYLSSATPEAFFEDNEVATKAQLNVWKKAVTKYNIAFVKFLDTYHPEDKRE